MPRQDRTGPQGRGPMSGRGRGNCAANDVGTGFAGGPGPGNGRGGRGRCQGQGQGLGRGQRGARGGLGR
ncbi:hypothetical protein CKO41_12315 [Thiococcus pfennigii]|nr:hypothetical protein [Thiococcus pfennigii]MBK1732558.1 hypothetical protein [Thiococcus pfennigii]